MLSSFEEDFQRFALNLPCSNCFDNYFEENVGVPLFEQSLITHAQGLSVCNI